MASFNIPSKSADMTFDYYEQLIKYNIFKEAYRRDSDAIILNSSTHDIQITEIQKKYLPSGSLDEYKRTAKEMEKKNYPLIQFVGNVEENKIRITFNGRTY